MNTIALPYILGLDLGSSSVGWSIIQIDGRENPVAVVGAGSRVFAAGLNELDKGKGESPNLARRTARLRRRQLDRRARRRERLFRLLCQSGLLPRSGAAFAPTADAPFASPAHRQQVIDELYRRLVKEEASRRGLSTEEVATKLPYLLRERALSEALDPSTLGMVLYQLAARRGYLSNRKEAPPKESKGKSSKAQDADSEAAATDERENARKEEARVVLDGIKSLREQMGDRTLGQHLATIDTPTYRIRARYTERKMLVDEFDQICLVQVANASLDKDLVKQLKKVIFHQRPLKSAAALIGYCEVVPKARRAPMALWSAQRYRLLAAVNNVRVLGQRRRENRSLTPAERDRLIERLEHHGDLSMAAAKKLLELPKDMKLNLETQGRLKGNRTTQALREAFGAETWDALDPEHRDALVHDLRSITKPETFQKRLVKLGATVEAAIALHSAENAFEDDYLNFSLKALREILPLLEAGEEPRRALEARFPAHYAPKDPLDRLPPIGRVMPGLRNPLVTRCLTEVRRVVNAIIDRWGLPAKIRVELARDLKSSAKDREATHKRIQQQEKARKKAAERLLEIGVRPTRAAIEKVLLMEECGGVCPYSGRSIALSDLVGHAPQFDIEHIIPFSRSLDDSFNNKTLCLVDENRRVKGNKTPWEAYHGDPGRYTEVLQRVERFKGDSARRKLWRFKAEGDEVAAMLESFTTRQLNDTRYASKEAGRFLSLLYGGRWDETGNQRVQVSAGQATAFLRDVWDLNGVLSAGPIKQRDDHRHHALDAICVAMTSPAIVKALADAAERRVTDPAGTHDRRRGRLMQMPPPFPGFPEQVREVIANAPVTHRAPRILAGALHKETNYSPLRKPAEAGSEAAPAHHVRKPLAAIGKVDDIVDPKVRAAVQAWVDGGHDLKKIGADGPWPELETKTGRRVPIKGARIAVRLNAKTVGQPGHHRHVDLGNNSHAEIVELTLPNGKTKLEDRVVSMLEAKARRRRGEPVFAKAHPDGPVRWIIRQGDLLELAVQPGVRELRLVRSVSIRDYELVRLTDARQKKAMIHSGDVFRIRSPESFRKLAVAKVDLDPLGGRLDANR